MASPTKSPSISGHKFANDGTFSVSPSSQPLQSAITTESAPETQDQVFLDTVEVAPVHGGNLVHTPSSLNAPVAPALDENGLPLSKNKMKKLRKDREWEENRDARKAKRKEKQLEKKERKRAERFAATAAPKFRSSEMNGHDEHVDGNNDDDGLPPAKRLKTSTIDQSDPIHQPVHANNQRLNQNSSTTTATTATSSGLKPRHQRTRPQHTLVPLTIIIDCSFDDLMTIPEITSLCSQVTRCYSDCHHARYQPDGGLVISSFGGRLKERFDTVLGGNYKSWKRSRTRFAELGFAEVAKEGRDKTKYELGALQGAFSKFADSTANATSNNDNANGDTRHDKVHETREDEIVYLTADSPHTLSDLSPNGTYIVGGLIDKNRHKGLCYTRAAAAGIKTAKLPIGEFMQMQSRSVLTVNQVVEILLRWLEGEGWGAAFDKVIPKRKGGVLKANAPAGGADVNGADGIKSGAGGEESAKGLDEHGAKNEDDVENDVEDDIENDAVEGGINLDEGGEKEDEGVIASKEGGVVDRNDEIDHPETDSISSIV